MQPTRMLTGFLMILAVLCVVFVLLLGLGAAHLVALIRHN